MGDYFGEEVVELSDLQNKDNEPDTKEVATKKAAKKLTKKPAYDGEDPESDLTTDQKQEYAKGFFDDAFIYFFN